MGNVLVFSYPLLLSLSTPNLPYPTLSYLILPYPTLSYLILPYPILILGVQAHVQAKISVSLCNGGHHPADPFLPRWAHDGYAEAPDCDPARLCGRPRRRRGLHHFRSHRKLAFYASRERAVGHLQLFDLAPHGSAVCGFGAHR